MLYVTLVCMLALPHLATAAGLAIPMGQNAEDVPAQVHLASSVAPQPGRPLNLSVGFKRLPGLQPIATAAFQVSHDQLLHVVGVGEDLDTFFHWHPSFKTPSAFSIRNAVFPKAGTYLIGVDGQLSAGPVANSTKISIPGVPFVATVPQVPSPSARSAAAAAAQRPSPETSCDPYHKTSCANILLLNPPPPRTQFHACLQHYHYYHLWHPLDHVESTWSLGPKVPILQKGPPIYVLIHERYRNPANFSYDRHYETNGWFYVESAPANLMKNRYVITMPYMGIPTWTMILEFNDTPEGLVVDVEVVAGVPYKGYDERAPKDGYRMAAGMNELFTAPLLARQKGSFDWEESINAITRHVIEEFSNLQHFVPYLYEKCTLLGKAGLNWVPTLGTWLQHHPHLKPDSTSISFYHALEKMAALQANTTGTLHEKLVDAQINILNKTFMAGAKALTTVNEQLSRKTFVPISNKLTRIAHDKAAAHGAHPEVDVTLGSMKRDAWSKLLAASNVTVETTGVGVASLPQRSYTARNVSGDGQQAPQRRKVSRKGRKTKPAQPVAAEEQQEGHAQPQQQSQAGDKQQADQAQGSQPAPHKKHRRGHKRNTNGTTAGQPAAEAKNTKGDKQGAGAGSPEQQEGEQHKDGQPVPPKKHRRGHKKHSNGTAEGTPTAPPKQAPNGQAPATKKQGQPGQKAGSTPKAQQGEQAEESEDEEDEDEEEEGGSSDQEGTSQQAEEESEEDDDDDDEEGDAKEKGEGRNAATSAAAAEEEGGQDVEGDQEEADAEAQGDAEEKEDNGPDGTAETPAPAPAATAASSPAAAGEEDEGDEEDEEDEEEGSAGGPSAEDVASNPALRLRQELKTQQREPKYAAVDDEEGDDGQPGTAEPEGGDGDAEALAAAYMDATIPHIIKSGISTTILADKLMLASMAPAGTNASLTASNETSDDGAIEVRSVSLGAITAAVRASGSRKNASSMILGIKQDVLAGVLNRTIDFHAGNNTFHLPEPVLAAMAAKHAVHKGVLTTLLNKTGLGLGNVSFLIGSAEDEAYPGSGVEDASPADPLLLALAVKKALLKGALPSLFTNVAVNSSSLGSNLTVKRVPHEVFASLARGNGTSPLLNSTEQVYVNGANTSREARLKASLERLGASAKRLTRNFKPSLSVSTGGNLTAGNGTASDKEVKLQMKLWDQKRLQQ